MCGPSCVYLGQLRCFHPSSLSVLLTLCVRPPQRGTTGQWGGWGEWLGGECVAPPVFIWVCMSCDLLRSEVRKGVVTLYSLFYIIIMILIWDFSIVMDFFHLTNVFVMSASNIFILRIILTISAILRVRKHVSIIWHHSADWSVFRCLAIQYIVSPP